MDADNPKDESYDARITALEVNVKGLVSALQDFKKDVDTEFGNITTLIRSLRSDITDATKTDWKSYFGGLAVLLVIIGMIGSGYVRDQERTENSVQILQEKYHNHEAATGIHWSLREQVLNNAATGKDNLRTTERNVEKLETDIAEIRNWQERQAENDSLSHTEAQEKILALERKVYGTN